VQQLTALMLGSPDYFENRGGGSNSGFLDALYEDLLNRPIDPATMALDLQALSEGVMTEQLANTVLYSREYDTDVVDVLYVKFLHRTADPTGRSYFVSLLQPA